MNVNEERQEDDDDTKNTNSITEFTKNDLGEDLNQSDSQHTKTLKVSQHEDEPTSQFPKYNSSPERTNSVLPNNFPKTIDHNNKYDRLTPNLPQIMSTRGSPRIDGLYPVDKIYQSSRSYPIGRQNYIHDEKSRPVDKIHRPPYDRRGEDYSYSRYHQSRYEAETESTWTLNYVDNRKTPTSHPVASKVSEDYYMSRERYTTMVGIENTKDKNRKEETNDEYGNSIKVEPNDIKSPTNKEQSASITPGINDRLIAPPELVRVDGAASPSSRIDRPISPSIQYNEDMKGDERDGEDVAASSIVLENNVNLDNSLDGDTSIGVERKQFM